MPPVSAETIRYSLVESAAGGVLLCQSDGGLAALAFVSVCGEAAALDDLRQNLGPVGYLRDDAALACAARAVLMFLEGDEAAARELSLDLRGTPFQRRVWDELLRIPRGASATYTEIARCIGRADAVRAVASAIGDNPVSLIVPCHRVARRDGSLGGYRWGLEVKRQLLALEATARAACPSLADRVTLCA